MKALLFSAIVTLPLLTSCGSEEHRRAEAAPTAPVAVKTTAAAERDWPAVYEATGTVRARTAAVISSKVMGYVQRVNVNAGDRVTAGQTLVTLDSRDLETSVARAEAGTAEVRSAIPEADHGIAAAKSNLDLAQATFKRMEDLFNKKSISNQEFDEAAARLKSAQAGYEMARAKRAQLDSKLAQAEQEVKSAGITRGYATLTAPFAGVVTARSVEPGVLAAPGTPLLTIEQDGVYRLEASAEESRIGSIKPGQTVEVAIEALDGRLNGRVSEIVPEVDAASRAYTVKIDLPALRQIRSGMFGRAMFPLGERKVIAAPAEAVVERGQMQSVFVAEGGIARMRLVTVGQRSADGVEILSGLTAGEQVVAPVPSSLRDGARLEVRQ